MATFLSGKETNVDLYFCMCVVDCYRSFIPAAMRSPRALSTLRQYSRVRASTGSDTPSLRCPMRLKRSRWPLSITLRINARGRTKSSSSLCGCKRRARTLCSAGPLTCAWAFQPFLTISAQNRESDIGAKSASVKSLKFSGKSLNVACGRACGCDSSEVRRSREAKIAGS